MDNISLVTIGDIIEIVGGAQKQVFRVSDKINNVVYSQTGVEYKLKDNNFQGSWPTNKGEIVHVFLE